MINFASEEMVTISQAAKLVPGKKPGGRLNVSTMWRWSKRGIGGIRLETLLVGGVRYTSTQAIQRFFERTTAAADGEPPPSPTVAQRRRALETAERILEAEGL